MDVADTFFPSLTTILIVLLIKSVSFHIAIFFDLYELCNLVSIYRHIKTESLEIIKTQVTQRGR